MLLEQPLLKQQRRNSRLCFLIALLVVILLLLGVWLAMQGAHQDSAAVDVPDVFQIDIAASKLRRTAREYIPKNDDTPPVAKDAEHPDTIIEQPFDWEAGKITEQNKQQDNTEKQETTELLTTDNLIADLPRQPAHSLGTEQTGANLPGLKISGLTEATILSLINAGKARMLAIIDDGDVSPYPLLLQPADGSNLQDLKIAILPKEIVSGLSSRRLDLPSGYVAGFPSARIEYRIRKKLGTGNIPGITYHLSFSNSFDTELAMLQREALAKAGIHIDSEGVNMRQRIITRFRLTALQNRPTLVDILVGGKRVFP